MPEETRTLAHEVRLACARVTRRTRYDAAGDLSPHLFTLLAWIEDGPITASEVANGEQVSAASMSRSVRELEERGLLTRQCDEQDRRAQLLCITPAGHEAISVARSRRDDWMVERLTGLTAAERHTLSEAAEILNRVVRQ